MARKKKPDEELPAETNGVATLPENPTNGAVTEPLPPDKPPEANGTTETNRPCKTFSCVVSAGVYVEASIWPKVIKIDDKEATVYSVTVRKSYKKDDGTWGNTNSLRGSEIHVAVHVLRLAETWIMQQRTTEEPAW